MKQQLRPAWLSLLFAAIAMVATTGTAHAQPSVTKMVVPFPPGGVTDQVARIMAEHMGRQLGQVIIIDNRPGAGSRLGVEAVIKSPGDGTTLLFTNSSYSILPVVDPKISFDPAKALAPVSMTATYGLQIVTKKDIPANTLAEFIAYAKKNPGKLSYGSAGMGSGAHFAGEYFKSLTGTFLVHIPYRSTAGALNDVAGGQLDVAFDASAKPLIDAGHVKLLAVTSRRPLGSQAKVRTWIDRVSACWTSVGSPVSGSMAYTAMLFSPPPNTFAPFTSTVWSARLAT